MRKINISYIFISIMAIILVLGGIYWYQSKIQIQTVPYIPPSPVPINFKGTSSATQSITTPSVSPGTNTNTDNYNVSNDILPSHISQDSSKLTPPATNYLFRL